MNEFKQKVATILKSSFRKINTTNGQVGRVILVLSNGEVLFMHPKAINNVMDYKLDVKAVKMLAGGTITYESSEVKAGSDFVWSPSSEEVLHAEQDLTIHNPIAIMVPTDKEEYLIEHCETTVSQDDWNAMLEDTETDSGGDEEPIDEEEAEEEEEEEVVEDAEVVDDTTATDTKPKSTRGRKKQVVK